MATSKTFLSIFFVVSFCLGMVMGVKCLAPALTQHHYAEKIIEKPAEIKETIRHEVETVIQYVPKETGADGRRENTDVEANIGQTAVNVKVNGQPYSFNMLQGEKQKFEDGKLVLNQNSNIGIELTVKPQVIDRTKRWGIGVGYGSNGPAGKIDFPIGENDRFGGWVYGDKKVGAAGVSVRF